MLGVHREHSGDRARSRGYTWAFLKATAAPWDSEELGSPSLHHTAAPLLPRWGHLTAGELSTPHPRLAGITCTTRPTRAAAKPWAPALLGSLGYREVTGRALGLLPAPGTPGFQVASPCRALGRDTKSPLTSTAGKASKLVPPHFCTHNQGQAEQDQATPGWWHRALKRHCGHCCHLKRLLAPLWLTSHQSHRPQPGSFIQETKFSWVPRVGFPKQSSKARFPTQKNGSGARKHMVGSEMRWKCWKQQGEAGE